MAIIKSVAKVSSARNGVKRVIDYVAKKAELTSGVNCSEDYKLAIKEFKETKEFYEKLDGRQYKHIVQSFKEGEVDKEKALKIGVEFCKKAFPQYEVFIATHTDRKHIHNHIVLNSVSLETGRKYHERISDLKNLRELNNVVCKEHGLEIPVKTNKQGKITIWNQNKYMAVKKGITGEKESDCLKLVNTILKVAKESSGRDDFITSMKNSGYYTKWCDDKKHIVFTIDKSILNGKRDIFRLDTLRKNFNHTTLSKEGLENEFFKSRTERDGSFSIPREEAGDNGIEVKYKNTSEFIRKFERRGNREGNPDPNSKKIIGEIDSINNGSSGRGIGDVKISSIADRRDEERKQREQDADSGNNEKNCKFVNRRKSRDKDFGI